MTLSVKQFHIPFSRIFTSMHLFILLVLFAVVDWLEQKGRAFLCWGSSDRCCLMLGYWKTLFHFFPVGFVVSFILYFYSYYFKESSPSRLPLKSTINHVWRAQKQGARRAFAWCARPTSAPWLFVILSLKWMETF